MSKVGSKNIILHTPYSLDGTGPYLLHIYATFLRGGDESDKEKKAVYTLKTCFNVRGKLNGVIP